VPTVPDSPRGLGRLQRHDSRSRLYAAPAARVGTISWQIGPILDQGSLGACTGYAAAAALNCMPNADLLRDRGITAPFGGDEAKAFYSLATVSDKFAGCWPPLDAGSSGLGVADGLKQLGLIAGYRHAFGLQHLVQALQSGPVLIGIPWLESMFEPDPQTAVVTCTGAVAGGHEFCAFGVDVEHGLVWCQQSWGPGWGRDGTFAFRFADIGKLLNLGGDVVLPVVAPRP
jgi:hypothetical protein